MEAPFDGLLVPAVGKPHGRADDNKKKRLDEISARKAPPPPPKKKKTHEDASRCSGPGASDSLLPVKQAPKAHHLPEKFVPAAINSEYVDFSEVLSSLSV